MIQAEIIAIGSELLTPYKQDSNSLWLTSELNSLGITIRQKIIVGDDEQTLENAFRNALKHSQIIICTGGLGPTEDDITRKIVARVLSRPLTLDTNVLEHIRSLFERRKVKMPSNNERQALIPKDSEVLPNSIGSAVGFIVREGKQLLIALPGPPREMQPMFNSFVYPVLEPMSKDSKICRRIMRVTGLGESAVDDLIAPIYTRYNNPITTILFNKTEIELHLTATASSKEEAENLIQELAGQIEERLGESIFALNGETLEEIVALKLTVKNHTIATAESCTGGLISTRLTSVPGSSKYFSQGVVSYSNESKNTLLEVNPDTISKYGAVSSQVAEEMAAGIKKKANSTIGISITGIAGPDGGTTEKPVGLIYIGIADETEVISEKFLFTGDRERIRWLTSQAALELVRRRYLL